AAVAGLAALRAGGGALVDVAMAPVARLARGDVRRPEREAEMRAGACYLDDVVVAPPRARRTVGPAAPLGAHTADVMAEIGVRQWD
ncbi:MAG: hypothetical protein JWL83_2474, partial [Actinomycetia bacterium]|nr:hypothetical protein [Actinomycetes bacterium]